MTKKKSWESGLTIEFGINSSFYSWMVLSKPTSYGLYKEYMNVFVKTLP